jgi:hypothetical protein
VGRRLILMPRIRKWQDRIVETPRTFTQQNNGNGTVTLIPSPGQVVQVGTPVNATNLNAIEADLQLTGDIAGTIQIPTLNSSKKPIKVEHKLKSDNAVIVRTDTFDYSVANMITEVRTLNTGETMIFKYNLLTLETEVI